MAEIRVTTAEVRNKSNELRQRNAEFRNKVQALVDNEEKMSAKWEGDAKTAFRTSFNNDKAQWDNFASLIDQYCTALDNIAAEYDQKESMNAQIASSRTY